MTYHQLRKKYTKFIFEKFEYESVGKNLIVLYFYSIPPDHKFTHKIVFKDLQPTTPNSQLESLIFHAGLSLMPSYWKATCSPTIEIQTGKLSSDQIKFWHKLFLKGMGEYFYTNQIDFTQKDFLSIIPSPEVRREARSEVLMEIKSDRPSVLVPIGGGKDSIVTIELLKNEYNVIPFVINPVPIIYEVIKTSKLNNIIEVTSQIDPKLLELNNQGYLNGHTPVSAFYSFSAIVAAYLSGTKYIAFSNERSSNEGNTIYLDHEINHQYSKTLEFESDLNHLISQSLNLSISCFSFLRPLYEVQITKIFSRYPQYFSIFSSCNQNFKLDNKARPSGALPERGWCQKCPKCVSTALMLACFIGKEKVIEIMAIYPPDQQYNHETMKQLLGKSEIKPFECVLTRAEAQAAFNAVELDQLGQLDQLLSSWLPNPNMPKEFEKILKDAL